MPEWVKVILDDWLNSASVRHGKLFRCICRKGVVWGTEVTEKVVWHVVKEYADNLGSPSWPPTISEDLALDSVTIRAGNWSRFNFYSATFRSRPQRNILGANNDSAKP
jgi:hypothetical protein